MTERPILFSAPMVRAILDGRKTQTRRVAWLPGPIRGTRFFVNSPLESIERFDDGSFHYMSNGGMSGPYPCPYGAPGDRLWVRETWAHDAPTLNECCHRHEDIMGGSSSLGSYGPYYRADECHEFSGLRWRPSIHMPRWASRITLEITDVRCQRLQGISEEDARAEGAQPIISGLCSENPDDYFSPNKYRLGMRALWNSINAKRAPWESNPFVWAITFRRVGLL